MVSTLLTRALILWLCVESSECVYKRWLSNTDFDNPSNWNKGHLPCPNELVVFPESTPSVAINQDWTLSSLVLPNDGLILLSNNLVLVFNENPTVDRQCENATEIHYSYTTASHWLDPSKWCIPLHDFGTDCLETEFFLHTEQVPCFDDDVIFAGFLRESHRSTFFINLDIGQDVNISSMQIGSLHLSTEGLRDYIATDIGKTEFIQPPGPNPPKINIQSRYCYDDAGCYCGLDQSPWKEKICSSVTSCPSTNCANPFTPTGHCCAICGSRMELAVNGSTYRYNELRRTVEQIISKKPTSSLSNNYSSVILGISRLQNGNSQLVLKDNSTGQVASNLAAELKTVLDEDMNGSKSLGILRYVSFETSETPQTQSPDTSTSPVTFTSPSTSTIPTVSTNPSVTTKPDVTTATTSKTAGTSEASDSSPATQPNTTPVPTSTEGTNVANTQKQTTLDLSNTGFLIGVILLAIVTTIFIGMCITCFIARRKANSDTLALSIQFTEDGSGTGTVNMYRGAENPIYNFGPDRQTENGIPLDDVSNIKTATFKNGRKKPSKGFINPNYSEHRTETVGRTNGQIHIDNPLYDETFVDFQPEDHDQGSA